MKNYKNYRFLRRSRRSNTENGYCRTLNNGVTIRLQRRGRTDSLIVSQEKVLEVYDGISTDEEAAYIEKYLVDKYEGVSEEYLRELRD